MFLSTPLNRSRTSADAVGLRASLPLKITSSMRSPRRLFALCSPMTHVIASATLLLPHPLGPTIAVTPLSKASSERSEKDLNPLISSRSRRMEHTHPRKADAIDHARGPVKPDPSHHYLILLGDRSYRLFAAPSPSRSLTAAPRRKTVVSVTRPRYRGKGKLSPNVLGLPHAPRLQCIAFLPPARASSVSLCASPNIASAACACGSTPIRCRRASDSPNNARSIS